MRSEKRIVCPACNSPSSSKRTPLAETFRVSAATSPPPVDSTTGSTSGNRTAHRTSCRAMAGSATADRTANPGFKAFIGCIQALKWAFSSLYPICPSLTHGTKVFRKVTDCAIPGLPWQEPRGRTPARPSVYTRELTIYMPTRQLFIYPGKMTCIHPQADPRTGAYFWGAGVGLPGKNAAEAPTHS